MDDDGFYVTLPCNASLSVYPDNRISSYRTKLATPIDLKGRWTVGLCEIEYPRSWYNFNREDGAFLLNMYPDRKIDVTQNPDSPKVDQLSRLFVSKRLNIHPGYYANVQTVVKAINAVLTTSGVLALDQITNKVFLSAKPNVSLTFYGKLAHILGLIPNVPLGRENYHAKADFERDVLTYAPHQTDIHAGFYTIYVYTDIIEYQTVGDSQVPLLRCVHITGKDKDSVSIRYDKPHYVSINKSLITDITVELKDDQNREIPFSHGKVVVKLHFKPAKQSVL